MKTPPPLARRLLAELLGSAFLAAVVIGSGIAAQQLSPHQTGLELLENAVVTAAGLYAIILMFGPVSGGHFNPVVSLVDAVFGGTSPRDALAYLPAQVGGCVLGAAAANAMFAKALFSISTRAAAAPRGRRVTSRGRSGDGGSMSTVLFVCLHNAGRSQMSQALFERAAGHRHTALSAGTTPADQVHPEVVEVMRELGIDLAERKPQLLTPALAERADVIVTMGCGDQCPFFPGKRYVDWELPDPAGRPIEQVRLTRDDIANRVQMLVAELGRG